MLVADQGFRIKQAYPVVIQRIDLQHIKDILLRPALWLTLAPLGHLNTTQIVGSVDISVPPLACHLSFELDSLLYSIHCGLILSVSPEISCGLFQKLVRVVPGDARVL